MIYINVSYTKKGPGRQARHNIPGFSLTLVRAKPKRTKHAKFLKQASKKRIGLK